MPIVVKVVKGGRSPEISPTAGSGGMNSQLPGSPATVSAVAAATGGIGPGAFIENDRN